MKLSLKERLKLRARWWLRGFNKQDWRLISTHIRAIRATPYIEWSESSVHEHLPTSHLVEEVKTYIDYSLL